MQKVMAVLAASLFLVGGAFGQGWWSSFIVVSVDGGGDSYYWLGGESDDPSFGTEYNGANLGAVNVGGSIALGADMRYWNPNQDRDGGSYFVSVNGGPSVETIWTQTPLATLGDYQGLTAPAAGPNVAAGAPVGTHNATVWAKNWGTSGDEWLTDAGNNFTAQFTVVPEPSSLLLGSMGLLGILAARRRR